LAQLHAQQGQDTEAARLLRIGLEAIAEGRLHAIIKDGRPALKGTGIDRADSRAMARLHGPVLIGLAEAIRKGAAAQAAAAVEAAQAELQRLQEAARADRARAAQTLAKATTAAAKTVETAKAKALSGVEAIVAKAKALAPHLDDAKRRQASDLARDLVTLKPELAKTIRVAKAKAVPDTERYR
jgi:hypothetical protein